MAFEIKVVQSVQSRAFVLTIPNVIAYITEEYLSEVVGLQYFVAQLERSPETGMIHYQAAICFQNVVKKSFKQIHEIFDRFAAWTYHDTGYGCPGVAWIQEKSKKSLWNQVRDYCTKDESWLVGSPRLEVGELPVQGKRSDLIALKNDIMGGRSVGELAESHFEEYLKHASSINYLRGFFAPVRKEKTKVSLYVGATGTGKSRACWDYVNKEKKSYYYKDNTKWWNNYDGQDVVIVDDYYGSFPFAFLLNLCDRYPLKVEFKGGVTEFNSSEIIFTSNKWPFDWYENEYLSALYRRIDEAKLFTYATTYPVTVHWQEDICVGSLPCQEYILSYERAELFEPFNLF